MGVWIAVMLAIFVIACETKQDQAKQIARGVIETTYKKDYPSMYKKLYDELEALYNKGELTYSNAEPICKKADEIHFKDYRKMRAQYSKQAKEKGVYDEYKKIMQKLYDMGYTHAPSQALWSRIDNLCGSLKQAEKRNDPRTIENAWYIFKKKFQKYYKQAYEIKNKCLEEVS